MSVVNIGEEVKKRTCEIVTENFSGELSSDELAIIINGIKQEWGFRVEDSEASIKYAIKNLKYYIDDGLITETIENYISEDFDWEEFDDRTDDKFETELNDYYFDVIERLESELGN